MDNTETKIDSNLNINKENSSNLETKNQETETGNYSIWEIEEFLKNGQVPPGIKTYEDMPPETPIKPSESKLIKVRKPWETEENIENFNCLFSNNNQSKIQNNNEENINNA